MPAAGKYVIRKKSDKAYTELAHVTVWLMIINQTRVQKQNPKPLMTDFSHHYINFKWNVHLILGLETTILHYFYIRYFIIGMMSVVHLLLQSRHCLRANVSMQIWS